MSETAQDLSLRVHLVAARVAGEAVRRVLRPVARRGNVRPGPLEGGRRLLILQLDGVSRSRLEWAFSNGHMPQLARRLARGGHRLSSSRSGAPASTPAFQAGLFYGVSPSVPGYNWYDRATGREVRMDSGPDACRVESRLAQRNRGLLEGGTSYFSIFGGGSAPRTFCLTGLVDFTLRPLCAGFNFWDHAASWMVHGVTAVSLAARLAWELGVGVVEGAARAASLGRLKHEPRFLLHRLLVAALMRELAVQGILVDMARGIPVVYADFVAYDEFAHRRGPDAPSAVAHLRSIDRAIAAIFASAEALPEMKYDVYVLSDHGNVATVPFESCTGLSLPEYLALADHGVPVPHELENAEALRLAQTRGLRNVVHRIRALPRGARRFAARLLDRMEDRLIGHPLGFARGDRVVTAEAGDLAHVYFRGTDRPQTLDAIRRDHPGVLSALRESRAAGLVAVRGGERGFVLFRGDELDLANPEDVARIPHPEPQLLAEYLADLLAIDESGDLVVEGWRGPEEKPVAYAWEFGSHGGIAPEETESFVIHPREVTFRFDDVKRPSELYGFFVERYRTPARPRRRVPEPPRHIEPDPARRVEPEWA
jgi:hypothetical protein